VLVILAVRLLTGGVRHDGPSPTGRSRARLILDERFARGELTAEQYHESLKVLGEGSSRSSSAAAMPCCWAASAWPERWRPQPNSPGHRRRHRTIVAAARERGVKIPTADGFTSLTGRGVRATIDGRTVQVGGPALLRELGLQESRALAATTGVWLQRGAAVLHVVDGGRVLGAVSLEDAVRPESRQAVRALPGRGIKVAMVTGDARQVAHAVAAGLGIDEVFAEVLPADKDKKVAGLQGRGLKLDLSRASYRKMWQNLVWATGYNIISVPLAAGVLAFAGIVLSPAAGAVMMSASTIVVALNAQLLRRLKLNPAAVS
jgi:Cu2+-exporting ATPase